MCKFLIWLMDNGFGLWSCMQHGWAFGMVVVFMDHVDGLVRLDFIGVVCGASTICFFVPFLCFVSGYVLSCPCLIFFSLVSLEVK